MKLCFGDYVSIYQATQLCSSAARLNLVVAYILCSIHCFLETSHFSTPFKLCSCIQIKRGPLLHTCHNIDTGPAVSILVSSNLCDNTSSYRYFEHSTTVNPSLCLLNDDSGLCISSMQKRMLFAGFTAVKKTIIQNWFTPHMCREAYWIRSLLQIVTCECATARVGRARPSTIDAWQCFLFDIRDCIKE